MYPLLPHPPPTEALKLYRSKLSAFEQTEILDYPEIYFLGLEAKKIEGVPGGAQNNGYDDENGSYIKVRGGGDRYALGEYYVKVG